MPDKMKSKSASSRKPAKSSAQARGRKVEKTQARERNGGSSRGRKG